MRTRCSAALDRASAVMLAASLALVALVLFAGCDRPSPLVLCHNANCVSPDVARDDTLDALTASLALTFDGRPVLDGVEWDTFWSGAENRCLFAHDLAHDTSTPASAAAQAISTYLATTATPTWNGERFYTLVELKGFVGESFDDRHTPEQLEAHADCALDAAATIAAGARAGGHALTIGFVAGVPELLATLPTRPRWAELERDNVERMLVGDIFAPYSSLVPELADYKVPLDAVEFHPDHLTATKRETYRSLGIDLVQWSFITTTEALASIERWEPRFVVTNEALLLRRWTEN